MSLKANDISKKIGSHRVLQNVCFDAEAGRLTGICGASGSGKSTLLRIIAGIDAPDAGSVRLDETDVEGQPNIAYLPPIVIKNRIRLLMPGADSWGHADNNQFEVLENALNRSPKVLLIDDSPRSLDRRSRDRYFATIIEHAAAIGLIVVYASSDFEEILLRCDKVAVLESGRIEQFGSPQEIYEAPATSSIAELTGRINLFEARRLSSSKADTQEFQTITGGHRLFAKRAELAVLGALNRNVNIAIRPEQLSISFGASFPEDNLLKAAITEIKFLGPNTLVSLDCEGLPVEALVPRLVGLNVGDECMVGLPPDRLRILNK